MILLKSISRTKIKRFYINFTVTRLKPIKGDKKYLTIYYSRLIISVLVYQQIKYNISYINLYFIRISSLYISLGAFQKTTQLYLFLFLRKLIPGSKFWEAYRKSNIYLLFKLKIMYIYCEV